MDPSEIEFLAEKALVKIVPNFNLQKIHLLSGDIGPFSAGVPASVPLWVALDLKQRHKCRILPPEWMDVEKLEEVKDTETTQKFFSPLPDQNFIATAQSILEVAAEDIPRVDEIRTLIKDIWDARDAKLRASVDTFIKSQGSHAKLDHLTSLEVNVMRPLLTSSLNVMYSVTKAAGEGSGANSQEV